MPQPVLGSCLCGTVEFQVRLPSLFCGHCHCSMCQRNHGAGFVTWFAVPETHLDLTKGGDVLVHYVSSEHGSRSFCGRCGSSLFCRSDHHPEQVDLTLASMHGPIDRPPQAHVFFDDRADWVEVNDGLPRLGGADGLQPIKPS